ncbi:MAG: hypothetical protein AAFV62_04685, partial [Pseudomonadota bacterium]
YLPYLATGDRWYLDQLQYQAAWLPFFDPPDHRSDGEGLDPGTQVRAKGWGFRTIGYAAAVTPDTDPLKGYFAGIIARRLADTRRTHMLEGRMGAPLGSELAGWIEGHQTLEVFKPFMQDFWTMGAAQLVHLGVEEARPIVEWSSGFFAGRWLQDAFDPIYASLYTYHLADASGRRFLSWAEMAAENFRRGVFEPGRTEFDGYPETAAAIAGSTRGSMAMLAGVTDDPRAAAAFAYVASRLPDVRAGPNSFQSYGQWALAPLMPDGTTLRSAEHRFGDGGSDRMVGGNSNDLLFGDRGDDVLIGASGHDFLIGWDGDDRLRSGPGFDKLSGGRGSDTIELGDGENHASGGRGADTFIVMTPAGTSVIHDFQPLRDRLSLPTGTGDAQSDGSGGSLFRLSGGGSVRLIGVSRVLLGPGTVVTRK